ncbi:tRNA (adenosine(37)-N6)-threonylcarbamoyltransferase complex ATPase subunit type 1 TsaE [Halorhodospira neutriphila]|uniref:tRNA threonylcarbamoyladenosine biosynthesis protein TsaE n=1 Tax=Halorhodospira neutriphila TaxID=168379 RepID=A0ABS1EAS5_9GAMM|nr:tRNA (adenosine(37)-N6)-threonylcarbamoyltransferase complex ATPase subunit type 1 TsaE [Halorhodospira neutriphila]MBK1727604.1 tRNA (adenosine(37)-N6)-threonylcarbamoyltransferase complex ATPase subunit type 1 TsaE [Halorhodospira neutriphila]
MTKLRVSAAFLRSRTTRRVPSPWRPVRSPTYTLMEPYPTAAGPVFHLDLYRLADPEELHFLGVDEIAGAEALVLIEWPERGGDLLPAPDLTVELAHDGQARTARLAAGSERGRAALGAVAAGGVQPG